MCRIFMDFLKVGNAPEQAKREPPTAARRWPRRGWPARGERPGSPRGRPARPRAAGTAPGAGGACQPASAAWFFLPITKIGVDRG